MKYIRTKDGRIIDTTKYYIENSNLFKTGAYQEYKKELANAYNQANTIEELCDEFVIVWKDYEYKHCLWEDLQDLKLSYKDWQFDEMENIFGAIWTDKGLIYVAKTNDKGELELL